MELTIGNVVKKSIEKGLKNLIPLTVNTILWILTIWIPYLNIGTTIGLYIGVMTKIARDEHLSNTEIFDKKYRKNIGEFIITASFCYMGIIVGLSFLFFPAIVIALAWSLAIPLVIDKDINPSEALTMSNKLTYGHKWTIFGSYFILNIVLIIAFGILSSILGSLLGFLGRLIMLIGLAAIVAIQISAQSVIYNTLTSKIGSPASSHPQVTTEVPSE